MTRTIFILIFIILLGQDIFAQNFGYLGKKNSINIESLLGFAIRGGGKTIDGIKSTVNLNYNFTTSKKSAYSIEYHHFKDYTSVKVDNLDYDIRKTYYYKQSSIGIGYKIFTSGIAPVGTYKKFSFLINSTSYARTIDFADSEHKYSFKIGLSFGQQRILADNFILNYGLNFYLNSSILSTFSDFLEAEDTNEADLYKEAKIASFSNYRDLVYFNAGIGYIF